MPQLPRIKNKYYTHPKTGEDIPIICSTCAMWEKIIHGKLLCCQGAQTFLGSKLDEPMDKNTWSCKKCYIPYYFDINEILPSGKYESVPILTAIRFMSRKWMMIVNTLDVLRNWGTRQGGVRMQTEMRHALLLALKMSKTDARFLAASLTPIINRLLLLKKKDMVRLRIGDEIEWRKGDRYISGIVKKTAKNSHWIKVLIVGKDLEFFDPDYYYKAVKASPDSTPKMIKKFRFRDLYKMNVKLIARDD